jgi:hypothetical protein
MQSVSYQRKQGDWFFPELFVYISRESTIYVYTECPRITLHILRFYSLFMER